MANAPNARATHGTLSLAFFEPALRRVMARPQNTVYKAVVE